MHNTQFTNPPVVKVEHVDKFKQVSRKHKYIQHNGKHNFTTQLRYSQVALVTGSVAQMIEGSHFQGDSVSLQLGDHFAHSMNTNTFTNDQKRTRQ
eukprot:1121337-Amphidinium_carterae.1